jgi:hypothetical protein
MPKQGNSAEEYEDAFAHSGGILAVADGASESSYADLWAQGLVRNFVRSCPDWSKENPANLSAWLRPLQEQFDQSIPWDRLPWYAEEKARNGAFAAFIGLRFDEVRAEDVQTGFWRRLFGRPARRSKRWKALAIGDCCLFQIREGSLLNAFPLTLAEQFTSRPVLLSSRADQNRQAWEALRTKEGDFEAGDLFLVATDALSQWILTPDPAGAVRWRKLAALRDEAEFSRLVGQLRAAGDLRNDDTTLVRCQWKGSDSA